MIWEAEIWEAKQRVSPHFERADWRDEEWWAAGKGALEQQQPCTAGALKPPVIGAADRESVDVSRPALFEGLARDHAAVASGRARAVWDLAGLAPAALRERFGAVQLELSNYGGSCCDATVSCGAFVQYMAAQGGAAADDEPMYVIDRHAFNGNAAMRALYSVPAVDKLQFTRLCGGRTAATATGAAAAGVGAAATAAAAAVPPAPPSSAAAPTWDEVPELCTYLLLAPLRTGSHIHQDPGFTSTSSMVVSGRKRWALLSPSVGAALARRSRPPPGFSWTVAEWFAEEWPSIAVEAVASGHAAYDFVQEPGELAYVPPRWWHAVLNVESGVAVLFNLLVDDDEAETEAARRASQNL